MDSQNHLTPPHIGLTYDNPTIKTSGPQKSRIQNIGTIGGGNQNNALVSFKTIHFHKKLIKGLLPFIMASTQTSATVTTDSINFINKNNARCALLALFKKISNAARPNPNKHF